jgi:glucokinase
MRLLAGDIGGTKTTLAVYARDESGPLAVVRDGTFRSRDYAGLEDVVGEFLAGGGEKIAAAAFGIAGPVIDGAVTTTNLPWHVEARSLAAAIGCPRVRLLNDLESTAYGALHLPATEIRTLQEGKERRGHRAVIAAGTGLGQAILVRDGDRFLPCASEGGHADFGPTNAIETELLAFLRGRFSDHVSWERVLSGPGLRNVYDFLVEGLGRPVDASVRERMKTEDPSAVIGEAAVAGRSATCVEAVDLFLAAYGGQAGNVALAYMAVGGVYVGGGIITRLLPRVGASPFLARFRAKGRYAGYLADIPVRVILNPRTSELGAAHAAADLCERH